jgi:alcohol dehydrogenase class IV
MNFSFLTASKIIFKSGAVDELGLYVKQFGKKFLIVTDRVFRDIGVLDRVEKQLDEQGIQYVYFFDVFGEPDVEYVDSAYALATVEKCDTVLSIGGGSLIDVGKATAALITNGGKVKDYLEFVGTGAKVVNEPVPFIAMPTTAGTGSEVTKNAVIGSKKEKFKRSMRDDRMLANVVIIDPSLTIKLPKKITATSGIDAMTHSLEAYVTARNPTPITKAIAFQGIMSAGKFLKRAYDNPEDLEAREGMSLAALCGGMSFANSGLGAAHGLGMALNIYYPIPHGMGVGITLPYVMELNAANYPGLYDEVGEALSGKRYNKKGAGTKVAIDFIKELNAGIGIPGDLKSLNVTAEMAQKMGAECFGSSMSGNPVQLQAAEWAALYNKLR